MLLRYIKLYTKLRFVYLPALKFQVAELGVPK